MKRLLLIGGGHAHLAVLQALARKPVEGVETILVTPFGHQTYSGMLPGWLAGHYALEDCQIRLEPLVMQAGAILKLEAVTGLDVVNRQAVLSHGDVLDYDLVSLDIGSESYTYGLEGCGERLLPIRPLDGFLSAWPGILQAAQERADYALAVVGAGAAGIELAFAIQYAFRQQGSKAKVHLVSPKLLQGHDESVVKRVLKRLHKEHIRIHPEYATGVEQGLQLGNGQLLTVDGVLAATGARPAGWLADTQLELDGDGYIRVNDYHQSVSHDTVFAAGDVCSRGHMHFGRSGVHAVHAGVVLAANIPAFLQDRALIPYLPKRRSLYLLATGPKHAIASWGAQSSEGGWVWRWKDYIDRGFIKKYTLKA